MKSQQRSFEKTILGIETSCDDTAMGLIDLNDGYVIGHEFYNQTKHHYPVFGGIFPGLAQQLHEEKIDGIFQSLMDTSKISKQNISYIAVTTGPGLPFSLASGLNFAKMLSKDLKIPILPIHHMQAHALVGRFSSINKIKPTTILNNLHPKFPFLTLLLSGGHSLICLVKSTNKFVILGQAVNWASLGNTLDRCVKYLDLYIDNRFRSKCGGQIAEYLAKSVLKHPYTIKEPIFTNFKSIQNSINRFSCDFDFLPFQEQFRQIISTKIKSSTSSLGSYNQEKESAICEIFLDLHMSIANYIWPKLLRAIYYCQVNLGLNNLKSIVFSGGCAVSSIFRKLFESKLQMIDIELIVPEKNLCRDNAIMIAWNAFELLHMDKENLITKPMSLKDLDEYQQMRYNPKLDIGENASQQVKKEEINSKTLNEYFYDKCKNQ